MDASDPIRHLKNFLWHGGRPHMGPGSRGACHRARVRATRWLARDDVGVGLPIRMSNSARACLRVLAARCARALRQLHPRSGTRAQGKPGADCTHGSRAKKSTGVGPQVQPDLRRLSLRDGVTASFALSPVTGLSCHRRRADTSAPLDASVGASGPHDFAVREACVRLSQASRPPHLTATFVTIATRPLIRVRRAELKHRFARRVKRNIFREGAGQVFADLPGGLLCRTCGRPIALACEAKQGGRKPFPDCARRNPEYDGTDWRASGGSRCPSTPTRSTTRRWRCSI